MTADSILENLVKETEITGLGFTVTLYVNGLIIVGNIIRLKRYCELMSTIFDEQEVPGGDPTEVKTWKLYREEYKLTFEKESVKTVKNIEYIHLEDAKIYSSQGLVPTYIAINPWRGKISSIDGWSIGLAVPQAKPESS